jgi:eukaryotic-like serine/threonine-protein kinase
MGYYRWKITKPGFTTLGGGAGLGKSPFEFILDHEGTGPAGMVHVPAGDIALFNAPLLHLNDYWMDKYEVTNKQFKEFVDHGGYTERLYWREKFVKDGRTLSWEQAMAEFRDSTRRPGPATWEVGVYPAGQADFPVGGVSWYEALAYAEFVHKQIPTVHHWSRAAGIGLAGIGLWHDLLLFGNFASNGPVKVGSRASIGSFGTYDLGGNVKEWCFNANGDRRYSLGGGWNEISAYYATLDSLSPFTRLPVNGFRCVKYSTNSDQILKKPVAEAFRDLRKEKPVSDKVFRILLSFYSYDHSDLNAIKEPVDQSSQDWKAERISFDAAYDHQRVTAFLYLPRNTKPPYQTVIFHPAGLAYLLDAVNEAELKSFDFLMKTGRAVLLPIFQGTYGRPANRAFGPHSERDADVREIQDMQRALDYLETRSDIAIKQLGYFGISAGGRMGFILLGQDKRIRVAAISEGGSSSAAVPPEIDAFNFTPRIRIPLLLLNGRYDFFHPVDTDRIPTFQIVGSPAKDKKRVVFETGHVILQPQQFIKEVVGWFDRYLGPVN